MKTTFLSNIITSCLLIVAINTIHAQKSTYHCFSGNCKNGKGIQTEKIKYSKNRYTYLLHIANFVKGKKQGEGISITFDGPYGCYTEMKQYLGETDIEKIPYCSATKSIDKVTFEDDQVKAGSVISKIFDSEIKRFGSWSLIVRKNKNFLYANEYINEYESPKKIILYQNLYYTIPKDKKDKMKAYKHYEIDSIKIDFDNGYYKEKHDPVISEEGKRIGANLFIERKIDDKIIFSFNEFGSDWVVTNKNDKGITTRDILFVDRGVKYQWDGSRHFTFPEDQNNYKEIKINDSTFYKGGTKNNLPHGFGILTTTLSETKRVNYSYQYPTIDHFVYKKIDEYSGYFINGKKEGTGMHTVKVTINTIYKSGKSVTKDDVKYKRFGDFTNDALENGWTILYTDAHNLKIEPGKLGIFPTYDMVFKGKYHASGSNIFPFQGTSYKRIFKSSSYELKLYQVGYFDIYGNLVNGKEYESYSEYVIVNKGKPGTRMVKAYQLNNGDVALVNGIKRMVAYQDANNVYFTDGTIAHVSDMVEALPPSASNEFMCKCPECDGLGYTITNNTYTETDSHYEQKVDNVNYLGYQVVTTYKVTDNKVKTQQLKHNCNTCGGRGKIICK